MKYTAEFKYECVQKYINGDHIQHPVGHRRRTFMHQVRLWVRYWKDFGFDGLKHSPENRDWSREERFTLVSKVLAGNTIRQIALEAHVNTGQLYKWIKNYQDKGLDGLECRRGRKPKEIKMSPKKKIKLSISEQEELKLLRERNEYLEMENEYLKKLDALVAQREAKQLKAKKQK